MMDHPLRQGGRDSILEEDPDLLTVDVVHSRGQEEPGEGKGQERRYRENRRKKKNHTERFVERMIVRHSP